MHRRKQRQRLRLAHLLQRKTLTSFKASTLLKENDHIHKCVFVVDRKDLDRQTREEFNKFQEGCVEENTNTGALVAATQAYADAVLDGTIALLASQGHDVLLTYQSRFGKERWLAGSTGAALQAMIAEEMGTVLERGALSPNIRERRDASAAVGAVCG